MKRQELTEGICTCAGEDDIRQREEILQFFADVFLLQITGADKLLIQIAFSAQMHHIKGLKQRIQRRPETLIQDARAGASADHQKDRLFS